MKIEFTPDEIKKFLAEAIERKFRGYRVEEIRGFRVYPRVEVELEMYESNPDAFREDV